MKLFFVGYKAKFDRQYAEALVQADSQEQLEEAIRKAFPGVAISVSSTMPWTVEKAINMLRNGVAL